MSIISNSVQNNGGGTSQGIRSHSRTYRSGNSTLHLREGQMLKGVVSDVHGSELTLSTEDGSSFTGKLPDANQYSIGQKAAFVITELDDNTIYMKATTDAYLLDMEDTIAQALEEAGLPRSTRNLDVVRSLLTNRLSISRENIMSSIQLCARYPKADVDSVITMNRLGMTMNEGTVRQFENYQHQTHQLLYKMDSLGDSISQMLQAVGSRIPRFAQTTGIRLLILALDSSLSPEEEALSFREDTPEVTAETALSEETDTVESSSTAPAENTNPLSRMRQLISTITDSNKTVSPENTPTPFIREQIGFFLSSEEIETFTNQLMKLPIAETIRTDVEDGSITVRELLTQIKEAFPFMTEEQSATLLTSHVFQKIVKARFLSNWTISPEQLKKDGTPAKVYETMSKQLTALSHFSEITFGKDVFKPLSDNASDINDNLNFMKTLNETFQYIQLPLKLQNQNAHGDLYVMTRKEALKKDMKNLSVLLHLEMDYLGTLDVQIARENTAVSLKFFVGSKETLHLFERNMELLKNAMNEQGYAFTSELSLKEKDVDIVSDFIAGDESPTVGIKRYNFDLRA